jgi:hypothetical protein
MRAAMACIGVDRADVPCRVVTGDSRLD